MHQFKLGIGIIIPNYNGEAFIVRTVDAAVKALENFRGDGNIYVVDDASKDQSVFELEKAFATHHKVQIIKRTLNGGFGEACWTGCKANRYNTVLFLNSDVLMQNDALTYFWKEMLKLDNENLFAITGNYVDENGIPVYSSLSKGSFHMGLLRIRYTNDPHIRSKKAYHLYANGGFSLFRMERFLELGGFSPIFRPFYEEDVDLSLRAARKGYKLLYLPEAKGIHEYSKTIRKHYARSRIKIFSRANRIIQVWIHMDCMALWSRHIIAMIFRTLGALLTFDKVFLFAMASAISRINEVIKERKKIEFSEISLLNIIEETSRWDKKA